MISEPERRAASTTTTPTESPEISRLRRGKSLAARLPGERHLGQRRAGGEHLIEQARVLGRIDVVVPAGEHRDRAGRKAGAVGGGIDAAREPRGDDEARFAELAREPLGEFHARRRGIARAHHGDHRHLQRRERAAHGKERRRVIDHRQARRIVGLGERDQRDAAPARGVELALGLLVRTDAHRSAGAAAPRQIRQRVKRRPRTAAVTKERVERARPHVLAADEAQPAEPLVVGQADAFNAVPALTFPPMLVLSSIAQQGRGDN